MAKPGRKPIPVDLKQVEALASQGLTDQQIMHAVGINRDGFYKRKRSNPAMAECLKRARAHGQAHVVNSMYQQAISGKNVVASIFWLKCRGGWSDRMEQQASDRPIQAQIVSYGSSKALPEDQFREAETAPQDEPQAVQVISYGSGSTTLPQPSDKPQDLDPPVGVRRDKYGDDV